MSRSILYACILSILLYQFFDYYLNIEDDDDPPVYSGIARGATANRTGAGENVNASKYALRCGLCGINFTSKQTVMHLYYAYSLDLR
jgi:hypothetical protein